MNTARTAMTRGALSQTALRVLEALLGHPAGLPPPTVRELARGLGVSANGVHMALWRLRSAGLVGWQDGQFRTLRACCKFIPADRLGKEGHGTDPDAMEGR